MRDGPPRQPFRGGRPRQTAPRNTSDADLQNPYRAYRPYGETRGGLPAPRPGGARVPSEGDEWDVAAAQSWTTSHAAVVAGRHHGFSLFHDGNAGHLWRAEVASTFGEALLSAGMLMWLAYLPSASLNTLVFAVLSLALPWVLAGPFAAPLRSVAEPGRPLAWIGRARAVLALGLIAMHFRTIFPVVYLLLFAISLCGRIRGGLRVAAMRTCLAPGEPERVMDDLFVGSAIATVLGPLLATAFFVLVGERIPLVAVAVAVCFFLCANSDGFLDALPPNRRAYLLAMPSTDDVERARALENDDEAGADDAESEEARNEAAQRRRERILPEWYQQGPGTIRQELADLGAGFGLAGVERSAFLGLLALVAAALVAGGLSVIEVLYVTSDMGLASFYLGPLLAAEGAGVVLGAFLAEDVFRKVPPRLLTLLGLAGSGCGVALLAVMPLLPQAFGAAIVLGASNALALSGARRLVRGSFLGAERRALSSAEALASALAGIVGAVTFAYAAGGKAALGLPGHSIAPSSGLPLGEVLLGMGASLIVAAALFLVAGVVPGRSARAAAKRAAATSELDGDDLTPSSAYLPAIDDYSSEHDAYDDEGEDTDSAYGPASSRYSARYDAYDSAEYEQPEDDDYDDPPSRRGRRW